MSCECGSNNRYVPYIGMGQVDEGALVSVIGNLRDLWNNLVASLGIGAGRREADVITPLQNKVVNEVIAPADAYIDAVVNKGQAVDCSKVRNLLGEVNGAERQWLNYLHTTQWKDGRAAQQAETGLQPYFNDAKNGLQHLIDSQCSNVVGSVGGDIVQTIGNVLTTPSGGMNWPVIALGAGAVYFLMRRK